MPSRLLAWVAVTQSVLGVWRQRDALRLLVRRDLTVKYQGSVLGYLWSMLEPLAVAFTYWFVFGVLYQTRPGPNGEPYILFLVSGLFAWIWVNSVLGEATVALSYQHRMITTINVPRELFPIGKVLAKFIEYVASLPVLVIVALLFGAKLGVNLLLLPVAVALQMILLIGLAMMLSAFNVMLRDTERFMRLLQRILMYALPIIYPLSKLTESDAVPQWVKTVYQLNPLVGILELHHAAWSAQAGLPSAGLVLTSVIGSIAILLIGWVVFRRLEPAVLKEL